MPPEEKEDEFVLFLDYNFGRKTVAAALRAANIECEVHIDHFAQDAPDIEWLPQVAEKGWFVVTKDEMIGRRILELEALRNSNSGVFVLASKNLTGPQMGELLVNLAPKMRLFVRKHSRPFIAKFYKDGRLEFWR